MHQLDLGSFKVNASVVSLLEGLADAPSLGRRCCYLPECLSTDLNLVGLGKSGSLWHGSELLRNNTLFGKYPAS